MHSTSDVGKNVAGKINLDQIGKNLSSTLGSIGAFLEIRRVWSQIIARSPLQSRWGAAQAVKVG